MTSVEEFIGKFVDIPLPGFYARGEPREYETLFLPSIWRGEHEFDDRTPLHSATNFTVGEYESLQRCQENLLAGKIKDEYFCKFIDNPANPIDLTNINLLHWAALAQHYNIKQCHPTRLVDVTRDPLVALYFAVVSEPEHSGFVYYFKDNFNEITRNISITIGGTYFEILTVTHPGDKYPYNPDEDTLAVAKTPFPNRRVEAQRGAFCWTRGIDHSCHKGGLIIEIEPQHKELILHQLERLNYADYTLFPI